MSSSASQHRYARTRGARHSRRAPGSSSPRPRLTPPPREGLAFHGFHWQRPCSSMEGSPKTALRAHVFPRIKCPEKIVDSRARVGVLAPHIAYLWYRSATTDVTASQGFTRGQPGCLPDEAPNRRGRRMTVQRLKFAGV